MIEFTAYHDLDEKWEKQNRRHLLEPKKDNEYEGEETRRECGFYNQRFKADVFFLDPFEVTGKGNLSAQFQESRKKNYTDQDIQCCGQGNIGNRELYDGSPTEGSPGPRKLDCMKPGHNWQSGSAHNTLTTHANPTY